MLVICSGQARSDSMDDVFLMIKMWIVANVVW